MSGTQNRLRGDTTVNVAAMSPVAQQRELIVDITRKALVLGDGSAAPGHYVSPFAGTWTPTIGGSTTAGTPTYATQEGWYIKIGTLVVAQFRIVLTGAIAGSPAGVTMLGGLPFTALNVANSYGVLLAALVSACTHQSGYTQWGGYVQPNDVNGYLCETGSANSYAQVPIANVGSGAEIIGLFIYQAASDSD